MATEQTQVATRERSVTPKHWDGKIGDRSIYGLSPDLKLNAEQKEKEYLRCLFGKHYFINNFCWIEDKTKQRWLPFVLWPKQWDALQEMSEHDAIVVVKARRLGLTWLCVADDLWMLLFRPGTTSLFFSRTDKEAVDLLNRLRNMHARLPRFLQASIGVDNAHELELPKLGSKAQAFPSTEHAARSYEATSVLVDEADYIPTLKQLMVSVKPIIEGGGRIRLVSSTYKEDPSTHFKVLARGAASKTNAYHLIFLPWTARPGRDQEWYDAEESSGDYDEDDMHHEYPATLQEAMAPRSSQKRFKAEWLDICSDVSHGKEVEPGLRVWVEPQPGHTYVIGADPTEGNPHSDPSPAGVHDAETWEQCAVLYGNYEPDVFGGRLVKLARWYNDAIICPERNNHGHATILAIEVMGAGDLLYVSPHDKKPGWLSSVKWKVNAVDNAAKCARMGDFVLHDQGTVTELLMLDSRTLKAPQGHTDDRAMMTIIALAALRWPTTQYRGTGESYVIEPEDVIDERDTDGW